MNTKFFIYLTISGLLVVAVYSSALPVVSAAPCYKVTKTTMVCSTKVTKTTQLSYCLKDGKWKCYKIAPTPPPSDLTDAIINAQGVAIAGGGNNTNVTSGGAIGGARTESNNTSTTGGNNNTITSSGPTPALQSHLALKGLKQGNITNNALGGSENKTVIPVRPPLLKMNPETGGNNNTTP